MEVATRVVFHLVVDDSKGVECNLQGLHVQLLGGESEPGVPEALLLTQAHRHPKVKKHRLGTAILHLHEEVACMGICIEEPVDEELLRVDLHDVSSK